MMHIDTLWEAVAILLIFAGGGYAIWHDMRREEQERREWLRVNNHPLYLMVYGDDEDAENGEWDSIEQTFRDTGNPVG